jgi:hypothetical protein
VELTIGTLRATIGGTRVVGSAIEATPRQFAVQQAHSRPAGSQVLGPIGSCYT